MEISPVQMAKLESWMFYISYFIIVFWFATTDVVVEFQEVDYLTPRFLRPVLYLLDISQLAITSLYMLLYCKIKFILADYRAKKQVEEEESERQRIEDINSRQGAT